MANSAVIFLLAISSHLSVRSHGNIHKGIWDSMHDLVSTWISKQVAGAVAVALVLPHDTHYAFGGMLAAHNKAFPDDQTIFEMGSITKGFTGLLLADQVLVGTVSLNDTLAKLLKDCPGRITSPSGNITLLELATHSSGLPHMPDEWKPLAAYTKRKLYAWFRTAVPFQRGSYLYSNVGISLLGQALAVNAQKTYEELLKERILDPLGLSDMVFIPSKEQKRGFALGHDAFGSIMKNYEFEVLAPSGALKSSIADLEHFLRFATGHEKYDDRMDELLEFATLQWGNTTRESETIGLSWQRTLLLNDTMMVWLNGGTVGYSAYIGWVPEAKIGAAVLSNVMTVSNATAESLALDLLKLKL